MDEGERGGETDRLAGREAVRKRDKTDQDKRGKKQARKTPVNANVYHE